MIKKIILIGAGLSMVLGVSLALAQLNPILPGGVSPVQGSVTGGTAVGGAATAAIPVTPKVDIACVSSAVEKRETAIGAAYDGMASAVKSALQTRKTDLLAVWKIENRDERRAALTSAWAKFTKNVRLAHSAWRKAREAAWQQFRTDRKQCGHGPTGEDPSVDASL